MLAARKKGNKDFNRKGSAGRSPGGHKMRGSEEGASRGKDEDMVGGDDSASSSGTDEELERELNEDHEAHDEAALDETVFNKFATGELDLPEDVDEEGAEEDSEDDAAQGAEDDSELEAYYEELGIDPEEVTGKKRSQKEKEEKLYKRQKKDKVRKERSETVKRERNEVI